MRYTLTLLAALCLSGGAQAAGDPENGRAMAERWCTSCHAVGRGTAGSDAAPSFPTLARERSQEQLRRWLSEPHPPMPNLALTRAEIEDVVAYLLSLAPSR
jgi:cytochrome c